MYQLITCIIALLYFFLITFAVPCQEGSLKLVQVIFRHGARNPVQPYPNDRYTDASKYWLEGWGQLTLQGKGQARELGSYIGKRYKSFLSSPERDIEIISSDYNRTIESGALVVRGIYNPDYKPIGKNASEDNNLNIAVECALFKLKVIPLEKDRMIRVSEPCPAFKRLNQEYLTNSEFMKNVNRQYANVFETFNKHLGTNITSVDVRALFIIDAIEIQHSRGFELPHWAEELIQSGQLEELHAIFYLTLTGTPTLKRLHCGEMLRKLLVQMHVSSGRKMHLYSGHETTLADTMNCLEVFNIKIPPFSSALIFELHKDPKYKDDEENLENYFVEIYYRNDTTKEPYRLDMPHCLSPCNLANFTSVIFPLISEDWEKECNAPASLMSLNVSRLEFPDLDLGKNMNSESQTNCGSYRDKTTQMKMLTRIMLTTAALALGEFT